MSLNWSLDNLQIGIFSSLIILGNYGLWIIQKYIDYDIISQWILKDCTHQLKTKQSICNCCFCNNCKGRQDLSSLFHFHLSSFVSFRGNPFCFQSWASIEPKFRHQTNPGSSTFTIELLCLTNKHRKHKLLICHIC